MTIPPSEPGEPAPGDPPGEHPNRQDPQTQPDDPFEWLGQFPDLEHWQRCVDSDDEEVLPPGFRLLGLDDRVDRTASWFSPPEEDE
jgi:hypothetical protein